MIYKCKMCKGDLQIIDEENELCECEYCGSRQTVPLENNERKAELYNSANQYRKIIFLIEQLMFTIPW